VRISGFFFKVFAGLDLARAHMEFLACVLYLFAAFELTCWGIEADLFSIWGGLRAGMILSRLTSERYYFNVEPEIVFEKYYAKTFVVLGLVVAIH